MSSGAHVRSAIDGFKLPSDGALTANEQVWIEFLRIICNDEVPAPDSGMVVKLRRLLSVV